MSAAPVYEEAFIYTISRQANRPGMNLMAHAVALAN